MVYLKDAQNGILPKLGGALANDPLYIDRTDKAFKGKDLMEEERSKEKEREFKPRNGLDGRISAIYRDPQWP